MSYRYALVLRNAPIKPYMRKTLVNCLPFVNMTTANLSGNPLWEIAGFGWAQIDDSWTPAIRTEIV